MNDLVDESVSQSAIEDRVRDWTVAITGAETIFSYPGAPRPSGPYWTINLISGERIHDLGTVVYEVREPEESDGEERIVERRAEDWEFTFSMHGYGPSAFDQARRLINSLDIGTVRLDHLHPLVVRRIPERVNRVPELINEAWENRAQFDVSFAAKVVDGYLIDVVESGEFTFAARGGGKPAGSDYGVPFAKE